MNYKIFYMGEIVVIWTAQDFQNHSCLSFSWRQNMSKNLWVNREKSESLTSRNIMNYCSVIQKAKKVIATLTHHTELMSSVNLATKQLLPLTAHYPVKGDA